MPRDNMKTHCHSSLPMLWKNTSLWSEKRLFTPSWKETSCKEMSRFVIIIRWTHQTNGTYPKAVVMFVEKQILYVWYMRPMLLAIIRLISKRGGINEGDMTQLWLIIFLLMIILHSVFGNDWIDWAEMEQVCFSSVKWVGLMPYW
jgi:hypothetical protein